MTSYSEFQPSPAPSAPESLLKRPEVILTLLCLLIGLGAILWRTNADAKAQQNAMREQLAAWSAAVEPELNFAVANAQNPTTLARNGGRLVIDFQRIRAQLDKMRDYSYEIFAKGPTGQKLTQLKRGEILPDESLQQVIRVRNYEFYLALQPIDPAHSRAELIFEISVTLLLAGLGCLLINTLRSRREMEVALANESRRLAREVSARKQLEEEAHTAKHEAVNTQNELKQARASLQQAQSAQSELVQAKSRLEQVESEFSATLNEFLLTKQALLTYQEKTEQTQNELQKTQEDLKQAQTQLQQLESTSSELSNQLNTLTGTKNDIEATLQVRLQQLQATLIERETRINALISTRESSEQKIADLEQLNLDLKAGLAEYQQLEAHAADLKSQLEHAQAELQHQKGLVSASIQLDEELSPQKSVEEPLQSELVSTQAADPEIKSASDDTPPWEDPKSAPTEPESEETLTLFAPPESIEFTELSDPTTEGEIEPTLAESLPTNSENDSEPEFLEPEPPISAEEPKSEPVSDLKAPENATGISQPATEAPENADQAKSAKPKRKRSKRDDQIPLLPGVATEAPDSTAQKDASNSPANTTTRLTEVKKAVEVNPAQLRKAVNQLLPLLAGDDPGAKECFDEHQETFRSVSSEEAFLQFEQWINQGNYAEALEFLKKATKRTAH